MAQDNWQHRSMGMKCGTCVYFVEKPALPKVADKPSGPMMDQQAHKGALGRCRRHAPCKVVLGWPSVFSTDFCGDHKLDEDKI